ncbi:unnamed protein product [Pipistrellus nathusii]|uniref:Uncharacterized protein n=1 Tax=Pipistrellus nathusii TaxID=59473 RepID=A0ABN9ZFI2_PIPNA
MWQLTSADPQFPARPTLLFLALPYPRPRPALGIHGLWCSSPRSPPSLLAQSFVQKPGWAEASGNRGARGWPSLHPPPSACSPGLFSFRSHFSSSANDFPPLPEPSVFTPFSSLKVSQVHMLSPSKS